MSPFKNAISSVRPETLYFLDENTMLTAGFHSHLVRVVDFASAYVTSICEASAEGSTTTSGDVETCQLSNPRSLLAIPSLYLVIIGLGESIGFIEISGLPSNLPKMYSNCSATTTTTTAPSTLPQWFTAGSASSPLVSTNPSHGFEGNREGMRDNGKYYTNVHFKLIMISQNVFVAIDVK